ncbi:MAG: class III extradiol ring-cleavage dioxygenase [Burkholderiaceae bacterium]
MTALDAGEADAFWRRLGPAITATFGRPRAVLAVSAHSLTREPALLAAERHEAVYDFGGFPDALYQLRYDAPGAPALAERVARLLRAADLPVHVLPEGGLDHGIWTPLRSMFPEADVPVLPLAWPPMWAPDKLFALGQALAPLADEGVLVMGSGAITHNLRLWAGGRAPIDSPRDPRERRLPHLGGGARRRGRLAGPVRLPHPGPARRPHAPHRRALAAEHVAAGAGSGTPGQRVHASVTYGHLGMDVYAFGDGAACLAGALAGQLSNSVEALSVAGWLDQGLIWNTVPRSYAPP